ncbi:hypothetical protein JTB14_017767 [Gonioctena quinquepunctata]|nr:hypothetical protein JTB14_017767 [Gonioctena quinquepunctata]
MIVMGYEILGLLDSGASATILGSRGWKIMRDLGIELETTKRTRCTVANGQVCESIGKCQVPFNVRKRVKLVKVLVVPGSHHNLILGINSWKAMGIVPNLRHNEWYFSNESYHLDAVDHLRSQTVLTTMEEVRLKALIDRNVAAMEDKLRCTHTAEHVKITNAVPIKQRYYPVSPVIQQQGKDHDVPDALSRAVPVEDSVSIIPDATRNKWYLNFKKKVSDSPLRFPQWRVCDDQLYKYVKQSIPELGGSSDHWKCVVPMGKRREVMKKAHDEPTSGHMGIFKTFHRLAEIYYWPKLRYDVTCFVRKCETCAAYKPDLKGPRGLMTAQPKISRPWEMVSTDLMGPLPRSLKGNKFILVVTDYSSKYSLVFPLRTSTAEMVTRRIEEEVILVYGATRLLLCDNGPQYRSHQFRKLA